MCIAVWLWQSHPLYPFILLFNRDQYHSRPSTPAAWWEEEPQILGGRDCLSGGTWLACSKDGRVAFLTNFLELQYLQDVKSRGDLVVRFLQNKKNPLEFALEMKKEGHRYNGFNLILADLCTKKMAYVTNRYKGEALHAQEVFPGYHVLTNANLDSPWPKAQRLVRNFEDLMQQYLDKQIHEKVLVENLMTDTVKAERNMLPGTGHDPDVEFGLSSIFVETNVKRRRFGTRSMVGLSAKATGEVTFYETYLGQESWKEHIIVYEIEKPWQLEMGSQFIVNGQTSSNKKGCVTARL